MGLLTLQNGCIGRQKGKPLPWPADVSASLVSASILVSTTLVLVYLHKPHAMGGRCYAQPRILLTQELSGLQKMMANCNISLNHLKDKLLHAI